MYKQTLWGFRRKALPLTILTGLFLLTVSVYEAIWGAAWAGPLVYLAPGLLFCLAALALLALCLLNIVWWKRIFLCEPWRWAGLFEPRRRGSSPGNAVCAGLIAPGKRCG